MLLFMPDFDPFNDRLARDIRNALAETMVANLPTLDSAPVEDCAAAFAAGEITDAHRVYLHDRLRRYQRAYATLREHETTDPFQQALVLWDANLFFEVHEIMESLWKKSTGDEKLALQAMFRAAGTYVHLEQGNKTAARSMADKAIAGFSAYGKSLPALIDLNALCNALSELSSTAPSLDNSLQQR